MGGGPTFLPAIGSGGWVEGHLYLSHATAWQLRSRTRSPMLISQTSSSMSPYPNRLSNTMLPEEVQGLLFQVLQLVRGERQLSHQPQVARAEHLPCSCHHMTKEESGALSSPLTTSGPSHLHPYQQGQLYCGAQARWSACNLKCCSWTGLCSHFYWILYVIVFQIYLLTS